MNEKELLLFNSILAKSIEYDDFYIDGFMVLKKINDFILKYYQQPKLDQTYVNKINIDESYKVSYEFLSSIDPNYAYYLEKIWNDGKFVISSSKTILGVKVDKATSLFCEQTGSRKILIHKKNTIEDALSIVHETIHDIYLKEKEEGNDTFHFLCEVPTILAEFLFEDYLKNKGLFLEDIGKNKQQIFSIINYKSIEIDFERFLLEEYYNNGIVNNNAISSYLKNKTKHFKIYIDCIIDNILKNERIDIDMEARNILGISFASYMHQKILDDSNSLNKLHYINENFDNFELEEMFEYLGFKIKDEETDDLTDESYKKIFKSYKKELKTLR